MPASAQDIPTDVIGDTGWILHGLDTLVLVRAADGNVWLQQNLGAAQVATAFNDAASFGDLYQWGRWDDGHAVPTSATGAASTLSPNNPSGLAGGGPLFYTGPNPSDWWGAGVGTDTWQGTFATTTNGIDPCTAFGQGWQLPTKAHWVDVLAFEGITNTVTAFASNLKMPAAGARDGQSGIIINAGLYGQYWSTTASTVYAKDLTVGDSWVNPDDDAYRSYGMCVRCLNTLLHVDVNEEPPGDRFRVFPNPSSGTFLLAGSEAISDVTVFASDLRAITTVHVGATSTTLSLDRLPDGLYWLRLETAHGVNWQKVVMER